MTYIDPAAKLLYHADRIAAIDAGQTPPPVNVEIDLSNRCNLGCKGCHMALTHSKGHHANKILPEGHVHTGDLMLSGLALNIIGQLKDYGVRSITWTGGGEPLIHPEAVDIFAACQLDQGLYTNGTMIDPLKAAVLKASMQWVYVSLDRHTRESYRAYKQSDNFNRAVAGIQYLVRASGRATVGVGFLLDADNWQDVYEMYRFGANLGADYVQFRPLVVPGADTLWVDAFLNYFDPAGLDKCIVDLHRFKMYGDWRGHEYPMCYWAQMQSVITPDGKVWPCVNRRGFLGNMLGNLNTETFADIWARSGAWVIDGKCRMLCRGHIPNQQLDRILGPKPAHWRFI